MIDAPESREGASFMSLTFQRGGVGKIAGSLKNEGKTGSEHRNGQAHGKKCGGLTGIWRSDDDDQSSLPT
jgi:hypothetical protein